MSSRPPTVPTRTHRHTLTQSPPTPSPHTHARNTHNPQPRTIHTHSTHSHTHTTHILAAYTQTHTRTSGALTHLLFSPQDLVGILGRYFMILQRDKRFYKEPERLIPLIMIRNLLSWRRVGIVKVKEFRCFFFSFILRYF